MYARLLRLEIKNFFRDPQFGVNVAMKVLMAFALVYFALLFLGLPFALYFYSEKIGENPLQLFARYFFYYWILDLVIRYFLQQMPTQNLKPFLGQNITKKQLVKYTIIKTFFHFFNWGYLLFLIPFALLLAIDGGYEIFGIMFFTIGILAMLYFSNFLNILLNGKNSIVIVVGSIVIALGALDYYGLLNVSHYSEIVFYSFFTTRWAFLVPVFFVIVLAYYSFKLIYDNFYLDKGLALKKVEGKTQNIAFLNRYGVIGAFVNNDIKLLRRSKAAKSAVITSFLFLFYGLLLFNSAYETEFMQLFAGIFVTGGFIFVFGQRVPAWDSSYYNLMMTQMVPYKEYLKGKWAVLVMGVVISLFLSLFYLFLGIEIWLVILGGGLYNLGVNSYLTLLAGAYHKTPIDLDSSGKAFGSSNNFNMKVILMMIPQLILPMGVYALASSYFGQGVAVAILGLIGLIGFALRDKVFNLIVKVYKREKYATIESFKKVSK